MSDNPFGSFFGPPKPPDPFYVPDPPNSEIASGARQKYDGGMGEQDTSNLEGHFRREQPHGEADRALATGVDARQHGKVRIDAKRRGRTPRG